ncbi:MAG: hypothetical protein AAGL24_08685 [Pseudomonadota bacterium]
MRLSSPKLPVFLGSIVLAGLVAAVKYAGVSVPFVGSYLFESLALAYLLLLGGVLFRGM